MSERIIAAALCALFGSQRSRAMLTSVLFIIHSYEDAGYEKSDLRKVRLLRRVV